MEEIRITQLSKNDLSELIKSAVGEAVNKLPKRRKHPYTKKETKNLFHVSYPTLSRWESKGLLERIEVSGRVYYTVDSVELLYSNRA